MGCITSSGACSHCQASHWPFTIKSAAAQIDADVASARWNSGRMANLMVGVMRPRMCLAMVSSIFSGGRSRSCIRTASTNAFPAASTRSAIHL